ncbi:MAG: sigma-70 family RNA polymerase sigma factor [bacterium]|nr:sigma-70 family RNA polymerase sigma factor [bacterium]
MYNDNIDRDGQYFKDLEEVLPEKPLYEGDDTKALFYQRDIARENGNIEEVNKLEQKIAEANLKLVIFFANKLACQLENDEDKTDIIQNGNLGLLTAIKKYDVNRGTEFSTYAGYWIKTSIIRNNHLFIKIPPKVQAEIYRMNKAETELTKKLERKPTNKELATALKISIEELFFLQKKENLQPISLDAEISGANGTYAGITLGACVVDENLPPVEDIVCNTLMRKTLYKILSNLTPSEAIALRLMAGVDVSIEMTLKDIGDITNVSKEQIRLVLKSVREKLQFYQEKHGSIEPVIDKPTASTIDELARYMSKRLSRKNKEQESDNSSKRITINREDVKNGIRKALANKVITNDEVCEMLGILSPDGKSRKLILNDCIVKLMLFMYPNLAYRLIIKSKRIPNNFLEHYNSQFISKEELQSAISNLSKHQQNILVKCYGNNLDTKTDIYFVSDLETIINIMLKLDNLLFEKRNHFRRAKEKTGLTVISYLQNSGYTQEEIDACVASLPPIYHQVIDQYHHQKKLPAEGRQMVVNSYYYIFLMVEEMLNNSRRKHKGIT